jgi:hypothetical protein
LSVPMTPTRIGSAAEAVRGNRRARSTRRGMGEDSKREMEEGNGSPRPPHP